MKSAIFIAQYKFTVVVRRRNAYYIYRDCGNGVKMATSKKGRVFTVTVDNVWKGENEDEAEISAELEQSPLA